MRRRRREEPGVVGGKIFPPIKILNSFGKSNLSPSSRSQAPLGSALLVKLCFALNHSFYSCDLRLVAICKQSFCKLGSQAGLGNQMYSRFISLPSSAWERTLKSALFTLSLILVPIFCIIFTEINRRNPNCESTLNHSRFHETIASYI